MDMRAERAARAHRIFSERELVLTNLIGVWVQCRESVVPDIGTNGSPARVRPTNAAASFSASAGMSAGLLVDELPEAPHVLPQLAHHEIGSVATEIFFVRRIFRREQIGGWPHQGRATVGRCICCTR